VCSDGDPCTSGDTCVVVGAQGLCQGKAVVCDDKNPCTVDVCIKTAGICLASPGPNNVPCDDSNPCTTGDACLFGACVASGPPPCDDKDPCTADACEPATGKCVTTPIPGCGSQCQGAAECNDGNPCTTDSCPGGKCAAIPLDGPACDDKEPCTSGETCKGGLCQGGKPLLCDDKNPCTLDACDKASGKCVATPAAEGSSCSDGSPCTQNDACKGGVCSGAAVVCSDANPCTADTCNPASGLCDFVAIPKCGKQCLTDGDCGSKKVCFEPKCVDGACANKPLDGVPCDDGNPCTGADTCTGGQCAGKPVVCDDGKPCTLDACEPWTGKCVIGLAPNGTPCDDGNMCTAGDACNTGACYGVHKSCADNDPCTVGVCDPKTGVCSQQPIPGCGAQCQANGDCNDGNVCTKDTCALGKCYYNSNPNTVCDDGNPCTAGEICTVYGICANGIPLPCDDKNPCTVDGCDAKTGKCASTPAAAGSPCDDGNGCTVKEFCTGTTCGGGDAVVCFDNDPCTFDVCDPKFNKCMFYDNPACGKKCKVDADCPETGQCVQPVCVNKWCTYKPLQKSCNDGNPCTENDPCKDGLCVPGTPKVCDDKEPCTKDSCEPKTGLCAFQKIPGCGLKCKANSECNDKDACTFDTCNTFTGNCIYTKMPNCNPNPQCTQQTECDDGDPCTSDYCDLSKWVCGHFQIPGCNPAPKCKTDADCDDKLKCTQDWCNTYTQLCQHVPLPGCSP
jgi:hypothetical protein